jgi:WS/DGAT/MGAT family acyltransferase
MNGIDPMFVYSDTPETPMEVAYACVFDPSTAEGGYSFEGVRRVLEERLPALRPFRRRLVAVPLGLDHPRWVDDPHFDLDNHLFRVAVPAPGEHAQFTQMVTEVMSRPLQPEQPPWEMHVVEGLAGGRVGLIAKVHHSVVDGVAGGRAHGRAPRSHRRGPLGRGRVHAVDPGPVAVPGAAGPRRAVQRVHQPAADLARRA